MSVKLIKGKSTSDETVEKAVTMVRNTKPSDDIEMITEISCEDIPSDGVLIVWPDNIESIVVPNREIQND
tara:strand:+ start:1906 stop:2115 length:210 start_codon:yes stop_codon:yes gene_type:complete